MFHINSGRIRGTTLCLITYLQILLFEYFFEKHDIWFVNIFLKINIFLLLTVFICNFFRKNTLVSYRFFSYILSYTTIFIPTYLLSLSNCNTLLLLLLVFNIFILFVSIDNNIFYQSFFVFFIAAIFLNMTNDKVSFTLRLDTSILIMNIILIILFGYFISLKSTKKKFYNDITHNKETFKNVIVKSLINNLITEIDKIDCKTKQIAANENFRDNLYIEKIKNASTEVKYLCNILTKSSSQQKSLINIKDCITYAIAHYPFTAKEKLIIHIDRRSMNFAFYGDKELMVQILYNLFRNALFSIKIIRKGEIYIKYYADNSDAFVHIKDTAGDISPQKVLKIFNYSFDNSGQQLGFQFCKNAMQKMNGDIECKAVYKEYTEFVIYLPLKGAVVA